MNKLFAGDATIIVKMERRKGATAPTPVLQGVSNLSQRQFVTNLLEHNNLLDRSSLEYAMRNVADALVSELKRGNSVKWEGLGIFSPTYREGRLNINFRPSGEALGELRKAIVKIRKSGSP